MVKVTVLEEVEVGLEPRPGHSLQVILLLWKRLSCTVAQTEGLGANAREASSCVVWGKSLELSEPVPLSVKCTKSLHCFVS